MDSNGKHIYLYIIKDRPAVLSESVEGFVVVFNKRICLFCSEKERDRTFSGARPSERGKKYWAPF